MGWMELTGEPVAQGYCHCDDCQAIHGAAYVPFAMYRIAATRLVAGAPLMWTLSVLTDRPGNPPRCSLRAHRD